MTIAKQNAKVDLNTKTPTEVRELVNDLDNSGKPMLTLCVGMVFYYRGGFLENAASILDFFENSMEIIGDRSRYFLVDGEGKFKKVKKDTRDMLRFWAENPDNERGVHGLILETAEKSAAFSDLAFQTLNVRESSGWCRLVVPVEHLMETGVDAFVKFAIKMGNGFEFSSGSVGYAMNQHMGHQCRDQIFLISRRFPGIDLAAPNDFDRFVPYFNPSEDDHIAGINWLTFLSKALLKRVGGKKTLQEKFSEKITIYELENGIMIQAGEEPQFGDVNKQENLPLYHEVGAALKSLLIPSDVLGQWNSIGGNSENTSDWLHRFDTIEN